MTQILISARDSAPSLAGITPFVEMAIQKRVNIIFEKNIRLNKDGKLHLLSEIKKAFKKQYIVSIHIVFLDSLKTAWERVQIRYEKIKRYVPYTVVKDTFENLFPNLNILLAENFKKDYIIKFWYNGKWDLGFELPQKAHLIGFLIFHSSEDILRLANKNNRSFITGQGVDHNNFHYFFGFSSIVLFLPKKIQKKLIQVMNRRQ